MKISVTKAKENRDKVLATASELFRTHGFDGIAVTDVMKAAGFSHGGFYNHFESKEALARAALISAWEAMANERKRASDLSALLGAYLSRAARNAPGKSCPAAALAGDVARQSDALKSAFADGLNGMIESIMDGLDGDPSLRRKQAVGLVTRMVGALILSRAVPEESGLADELLDTNRELALTELGVDKAKKSRRRERSL
jgi:TetR/AcrR family transcriptional repressor of nem operon